MGVMVCSKRLCLPLLRAVESIGWYCDPSLKMNEEPNLEASTVNGAAPAGVVGPHLDESTIDIKYVEFCESRFMANFPWYVCVGGRSLHRLEGWDERVRRQGWVGCAGLLPDFFLVKLSAAENPALFAESKDADTLLQAVTITQPCVMEAVLRSVRARQGPCPPNLEAWCTSSTFAWRSQNWRGKFQIHSSR